MKATDGAGLESQEQARITIRVVRNKNSPRIECSPCTANIKRDIKTNSRVFSVKAKDEDSEVNYHVLFLVKNLDVGLLYVS